MRSALSPLPGLNYWKYDVPTVASLRDLPWATICRRCRGFLHQGRLAAGDAEGKRDGWARRIGIAFRIRAYYHPSMVTMTVKLPQATSARLNAAAKARRVSKSQIVREALEKHLKSNGKKHRPTFGELAGDLIGSIKGGPRDLSTNPKHMEGFGE